MKKYILCMIPLFLFGVDHSQMISEGMTVGKGLLSNHTSNFDANVIQPVTTGSTMQSLDGSNSFTAQLGCSDADKIAKFLTVGFVGSHNIGMYVDVDFNLDGSRDNRWSYLGISGVCGNGVVKCDGAWNDESCKYYQWQYDNSANRLKHVEVAGDLVHSCYCTNNACGSVAISKREEVLNTLLTSITQTIANNNPQYILTKTEISNNEIMGYAQSTDGCSQSSMGSQIGVNAQELADNTNLEVSYQISQGDGTAYGFMTQQQNNTVNSPIKNDAAQYATDLSNRDIQMQQNQDLDQDGMKINSYGADGYTDSAELADLGITPETVLYCKVKIWEEKSIVFSDSTTSAEQNEDTKTYHLEIRECENNTCVYDNSNEEIVETCNTETNNFKEAVSQLAAINEASKDMVCSSN